MRQVLWAYIHYTLLNMNVPTNYYRVSLSEFRSTFAGKPPCANSIKKWIEGGTVPGEKIGSMYYVHLDWQGNLYRPVSCSHPAPATVSDSDRLLQKLIQGFEPIGG